MQALKCNYRKGISPSTQEFSFRSLQNVFDLQFRKRDIIQKITYGKIRVIYAKKLDVTM